MKEKEIKTIQAGPKNWQETSPLLLMVLEAGDAKGKRMAKAELQRMAKVADMTLEAEGKD